MSSNATRVENVPPPQTAAAAAGASDDEAGHDPPHFRLVFPSAGKIDPRKCWEILGPFTDTRVVTITDEGLLIQCMDSSSSAILAWRVGRDSFAEFDVAGGHNFGVIVNIMCTVLKSAGPGAVVEWESDGQGGPIDIDVSPLEKQTKAGAAKVGDSFFRARYTMNTVNCDAELLEIPRTRWFRARVATKRFRNAVAQIKGHAEVSHIYIHYEPSDKTIRLRFQTTNIANGVLTLETMPLDGGDYDDGGASDDDAADEEGQGGDDATDDDATNGDNLDHARSTKLSYQATLLHRVLDSAVGLSTHVDLRWCVGCPLYMRLVDVDNGAMEDDDATAATAWTTAVGDIDMFVAPRVDESDDEDDE